MNEPVYWDGAGDAAVDDGLSRTETGCNALARKYEHDHKSLTPARRRELLMLSPRGMGILAAEDVARARPAWAR